MSDRQPVQMTPEGAVRCCHCRDDEHGLPREELPISDQHWGVRFSPVMSGLSPSTVLGRHPGEMRLWTWKITLDGVDVTNRCFEFESGDNGWVALYHQNGEGAMVICKAAALHCDYQHALSYIERGVVRAEKISK